MMESFKQSLRRRVAMAAAYCIVVGILGGVMAVTGWHGGRAVEFTMGFAIGIELVAIYWMMRYIKAMRDEDSLKKLYIEENDERSKMIDEKVGNTGFRIALCVLALAMLAAGYWNSTVFFTLLAVVVFLGLLKCVLKMIYFNKG